MKKIHDKIRQILETTPGLTQRGLAERMGLNPAAVNRMLYGRRNIMADEIPVIEDYLGVTLDIRTAPTPQQSEAMRPSRPRGFSDAGVQAVLSPDMPAVLPPVPVFAARRGGDIIDWAPRHPLQAGVRDAYALFVRDDDMQPRYFRGETVYVHPSRPPMSGADCVIEMKDGRVLLRRLALKTADTITVQQFHPAKLAEIETALIDGVYAIIGRG
jgi:SOS-response transcriptional repressor LexA